MKIFKKGISSYEEVIRNEYVFYANSITPGMTVFDVGANVGEMSLLFSRLVGDTGKVFSFEPVKETFEKLNTVMQSFNLNNVSIHNLAVSDITGNIEFNIYDDQHSAWNTIIERPLEKYGINIKPSRKELIPCVSVDDFCTTHHIEFIDLLKIDVEGAELKVLEGAKNLFSARKIKTCLFEFGQTTFEMGDSGNDYIDFFKRYNYKIANIMPRDKLFPSENGMASFAIHYAVPK